MFSPTPSTNSPTQYQTNNLYSPTFSGPIQKDPNVFRSARNQSMAQAAFSGDIRASLGQQGKGIQAGSKQSGYRAGLLADANASKAFAQAQQDQLNRYSDQAASKLLFQERQAGESGWIRDLLLDKLDTQMNERKSAYKRKADVDIRDYQIRVDDAVARDRREAEIWSSML
jgi:hypothetical protein